jgi:hypothetical protein
MDRGYLAGEGMFKGGRFLAFERYRQQSDSIFSSLLFLHST